MEGLKHLLAWCLVINYTILIVWFVIFLLGRDWLTRIHGKMFGVPPEKINTMMYLLIGIYKLGILLLNLVPYLALRIVS